MDVSFAFDSEGAYLTISKHQQLLSLSSCDLAKQRQQVEWHTQWILTHDSTRVRSSRVEISQQSSIPGFNRLAFFLQLVPLSLDVIDDDQFDCALCSTVWVCGADWAVLRNGNHVGNSSRITVDGGRGGEDDVANIVGGHAS